jgi:hypothetical protein
MSKTRSILLCLLFCCSPSGNPAFAQCDKQPGSVVNGIEAEKWREDLRYLADEMPRQHRNLFHTMTRELFAGAVKRLHEKVPSLA